METKIAADSVNNLVVKDKNGLKYMADFASVDWASAEYAGFDIAGAGIFGYILPADNNSGSMTIELIDGYYVITQLLAVDKFTPSEKGTLNGNDIFFGQRIYNDETHDFTAFIKEAECERHPLTNENIIVDYSEEGSAFVEYDALRGHYTFAISGTGFNPAYYSEPNRHYNVRFTVKGDQYNRQMYFATRYTGDGCIECAVLLNDRDMVLPVPIEVAKNFGGDGENTIYNIDDACYSETYFPMIVNAGEACTYNILNLYQNWGKFPLKQISSIQFHTPYYHLSTGVTETNCITLFSVNAPALPDHRAMSAPFWETQPQHNSGGSHAFLRYTDSAGNYASSQNSSIVINSCGPTYSEIVYGVESSDGKVSATYTHIEFPQTDENRAYYEMTYTFNEDISFSDFANNFVFYSVTDNHSTDSYEKVGYLDVNNNSQVVNAATGSTVNKYILGNNCPYFSFFMMPNWDRDAEWIEGYTNLSMLFKNWTVISNGEEIETNLLLINKNDSLSLSLNLGNITFKKGDSITINAIIMPWGSQEMENDASNRLNQDHVAGYSSPTYDTVLADGTEYMDKNVRDVRENTLLPPLTATAVENAAVINSAFVPKVKSTNGKSATFTITGGHDNNVVRVYGFDKLTVPKLEQLVDGEWVEYTVSSHSTPDANGGSHYYDGYMAHYDNDGTYSYSFVYNMTDVESRTFRVSAEETFDGWPTTAADIKEGPMNIYINAETIYSKAPDVFYTTKVLSNDKSYVTLYPAQTRSDSGTTNDIGETFIELYSNGMISTGKYIVYKYRIPTTNSRDIGSLQFWTSTERTGAGGSDYIDIRPSAMQADGQWHVLVVDVTQLKQEGCAYEQNEYGAYVPRYLRVDVTNTKMNAGDYIDIGYVGFSDSLDEIFAANTDVSAIDLVNTNRTGYTSISAADHEASKNALIELGFESTGLNIKTNTFTLDLKLESISTDINLLRVIPQFDFEKFELVSVENGTLCTQMSKLDGSIIWNTEDAITEAGTLARFTFRTKETIAPGKYEFGVKVVDAFSTQTSEVVTSTKSGIATIWDAQLGDSNGDNKISVMDVTLIRKYIAAYNYETGESSVEITEDADVNLDGVINSLDVSLLRKYLANYDYETNTPGFFLGKQN